MKAWRAIAAFPAILGCMSVNQAGGNGNNEEKMTDPQKRYLFRLLAAQGMEGKSAEEHLKTYFNVASLKDVPKLAASGYIDQLAKDGDIEETSFSSGDEVDVVPSIAGG